jgi:hypothetical protein
MRHCSSSLTKCLALVAVVMSVIVTPANGKKKLARVKAGREHKEHDPIHVVVNKVG